MDEANRFVAATPINTANRRIAQGEYVTREDIEAGDRDFDVLRAARRIVGADTKAADKAAVKAKDADELVLADRPDPVPPPDLPDQAAPEAPRPEEPRLKRTRRRS